MRKYIKSKSGNLVYTIERQSFSETFRTPENYFTHATRNVWYSTTGFNMFVQYKGAFYMIDRTDAHGCIASLEFSPVTAEEAAAAKMERAAQAMSEAQEHEAKTAAAALDYNTETAEAEAREARFCADYAAALAKDAAELAAEAGTSEAASIADATAEYAEQAREYARRATETAEQAAAEAEQRAKADDAAVSFCAAYTEATGEIPYADDAAAVCRVARRDIARQLGSTRADREIVADMVEDIARSTSSRKPYQRHELEAYLGEPDDYDVDAIEAEATAYDPKTGAQVWTAFGDDLADAAERHELYSYSPAEDEPEPDEITAYMRRQAFGDYSHADATTREEMEAAALEFAAQEQTRLVALWQEAGARQARERYEADEATARDLMNLQDAGAITAEDVASYYQRHGWTPRKYHRN